jgi:hypothetical protein
MANRGANTTLRSVTRGILAEDGGSDMDKPDIAAVELLRRHSSYCAAVAIPVTIVALLVVGISMRNSSLSSSDDMAPWMGFGAVGLVCFAAAFAAVSYALKVAADALELCSSTDTARNPVQP